MKKLHEQILEELYFIQSFHQLTGLLESDSAEISAALSMLLQEKLIDQFTFETSANEFLRKEIPDFQNLENSSFVISKKGLLALHSPEEK